MQVRLEDIFVGRFAFDIKRRDCLLLPKVVLGTIWQVLVCDGGVTRTRGILRSKDATARCQVIPCAIAS